MKNRFLFLLMLSLGLPCIIHAQISRHPMKPSKKHRANNCSKFYLGFGLGINNPNGLIGLNINVPVINHLSISTGAGISSWGWKYFGEIKGYLGQCNKGWAAGVGLSHNTGIRSYDAVLETANNNGRQTYVTMDLFDQDNAFIHLYRFWAFGKAKLNRFYLMLGYSFPITSGPYYEILSQDVLTEKSKGEMKTLRPGGLSIGIGFYFSTTK